MMTTGIKTIIYPVNDLARAKGVFSTLLGVEPAMDQPYYVQFIIGDQTIGLDPNGHKQGMTAYWHVDDIRSSLESIQNAGGEVVEGIKDVGGGRQIAAVKDAEGNIIGLLQDPH
jgi:predicted enzyme related to lactoylglutathione lyase